MTVEFTAEAGNSEIRSLVVNTIEGVSGSGSVKSRLRDAARLLGLPVIRVRDFYHNRVRRIEAHEAFQIIENAAEARRIQFERARVEYEALRLQMVNSASSRLARLLPPSVAPLSDLEGAAEVTEP